MSEYLHPRKHFSICVCVLQAKPRLQREGSCASLHNSLMRNSIFQLMIHTLDPLSDEGMGKQNLHETHTNIHTHTIFKANNIMFKFVKKAQTQRFCLNYTIIYFLHQD